MHLTVDGLDRLFLDWCGVTPDQIGFGRRHRRRRLSSGPSLPLSLFTQHEQMDEKPWPVRFIEKGDASDSGQLRFGFGDSAFGLLFLVSDDDGLVQMTFEEDADTALTAARVRFRDFNLVEQHMPWHASAGSAVGHRWTGEPAVPLVVRGTPFQRSVWRLLSELPSGMLTTYGALAEKLGDHRASRAVGTAIGANPWAGVIPCHRVVQGDGSLGGFAWGVGRKSAMLAWEQRLISLQSSFPPYRRS